MKKTICFLVLGLLTVTECKSEDCVPIKMTIDEALVQCSEYLADEYNEKESEMLELCKKNEARITECLHEYSTDCWLNQKLLFVEWCVERLLVDHYL